MEFYGNYDLVRFILKFAEHCNRSNKWFNSNKSLTVQCSFLDVQYYWKAHVGMWAKEHVH